MNENDQYRTDDSSTGLGSQPQQQGAQDGAPGSMGQSMGESGGERALTGGQAEGERGRGEQSGQQEQTQPGTGGQDGSQFGATGLGLPGENGPEVGGENLGADQQEQQADYGTERIPQHGETGADRDDRSNQLEQAQHSRDEDATEDADDRDPGMGFNGE